MEKNKKPESSWLEKKALSSPSPGDNQQYGFILRYLNTGHKLKIMTEHILANINCIMYSNTSIKNAYHNKCGGINGHGNNQIAVPYKLAEVNGKRIFGEIKPMLRAESGNIIAMPKITLGGGRTCWLPDIGIGLKGIGTIYGKPIDSYGARTKNEDPDPIGGIIKDKAIYEHLANVYLYVAGVDVPEPFGVAMPYNIRGPNSKTIAVLARRPKTPIRVDTLLNLGRRKTSMKIEKSFVINLVKMHILGLVHSWCNNDNINAAGQILDFEGVRLACEASGMLATEQRFVAGFQFGIDNIKTYDIHDIMKIWQRASTYNPKKYGLAGIADQMMIDPIKLTEKDITGRMMFYYDTLPLASRVMPKDITDAFAVVFTDGKIPLKDAMDSMRDPRDIFGKYAKTLLNHANIKVREKARQLYGRYENDVKETMKVASRFQKEIDYVKKNYL